MKHNLLKSVIISVILLMGVSNAWAGITAVAVEKPSNSLDYNKVKLNIDHKGTEGDEWEQLDMTLLPITFEGKNLYIKEYTLKYSGDYLGALQFQLYTDGTWVDENMPILGGGWTLRPNDQSIWNYEKDDNEADWYTGLGFVGNSNFYFDATDWSDMSNVKLCIAHLTWHEYYELTNIPNTKLYYVKHPGGWGDAMGISVVTTTDGGGQGIISEIPNSAQKYTGFRHWGFENAGTTAYFMVNKGDRGEMPDMYYYGDYNSFNHTQTIKTAIKNANGNYVVENSKATITIKSYKITGNGVATEQNNSLTTSSNTATISAARTATTTLTVDWGSLDPNYKFEGWYDENGNQLETKFAYTYNPTTENTIYARFKEAPSRTVYLKPNNVWKEPGDRFVAKWIGGEFDVAYEMLQINNSDYYKYEIPGRFADDYQTITFHKIKSDAGIFDSFADIDTEAGETANLKIPAADDPNKLYDMTKIYLKPNDTWKNDGARFAAYFWVSGSNPVQAKWMSMSPSPENDGTYYCDYPTDHAYDHVIFSRMNPTNTDNNFDNRWNSTIDLSLHNNKKGYGNLFQINSFVEGVTEGEWKNKWIDPHLTVTLKPTAIGQFTFEYNNQQYTNLPNKDVTFKVMCGSTITLVESGHYNSNVYNGDLNKNGQLLNFPEDKIHVINENTEFKEDFVVKKGFAPITVYLRIPKVLDDTIGSDHWQSGRKGDTVDDDRDEDEEDVWKFANFVWLDGIGAHEQVITQSTFDDAPERVDRVEPRHYRMQPVDVNDEIYNIYTCTILDSCFYGLKFEYKHIDGDHLQGGINQTQSQNLVNFDQTNCFTITKKQTNGNFTGYWDKYTEMGDYRMLYVEQEVAKGTGEDNWKTVINRTKCHPSDIIKKGAIGQTDTVSLHINTAGNNPEVILQQYQTVDGVSKWVDIEAHMVNGPLKADAGMAMINGRRNAGANSNIDDFVYDDGIEVIKNDDKYQDNSNDQGVSYKGSGVWNFIITQSASTAVLDMTNIHRYNGKYYIRVEYKGRYWETYRISSQEMTYSSYSEQNSRFSHYFCEWLEATGQRNVKFVVANEYSSAISDTLIADRTDLWGKTLEAEQIMVPETGVLPQDANVRFSWEDMTNKLHRAYLRGASNVQDRFLVVEGETNYIFNAEGNPLQAGQVNDPRFGLNANEEIFSDFSNWVYSADIKMKPNANIKLVAEYTESNIKQYLYGGANEWCNTILQGANDDEQSYLIRLLYDFKTNELITAFIPGDIENIGEIQSNLMLIRTEDYVDSQEKETLKQLSFTTNEMVETGKYAYGVLEITKNRLTSQLPYAARTLYWVSFPFDVKVDDVLSSGVYGKHWIIQSYNGQRRADEGLYLESKTFWDYHFDPNTINKDTEPGVLKAGKGYVVALNYLNIDKDQLLDNGRIDRFCLYFRSKNTIENDIVKESENITITVDAHECSKPKREIADSHWNVIGVPSYLYAGANFTNPIRPIDENKYYYAWQGEKDKYEAISSTEEEFKPMHAYMVQYAGNLTWTNTVIENQTPTQIAARKNAYNNDEHNLRLEIQQNSTEIDRTFITLQEDDVTTRFDFNYDLCKITNAGANIYSIITDEVTPVQVAANVLPIVNTTIPVGVQIATAGEYTFAMPDGTDGIIVELIDYETNTRTNLLLSDYTVNLPAGTNDTRFALHVQPSKVTTSIENGAVEGESGKVRKLVIDGKLLLQKGNTLYDAQGHIVR